MTTNWSALPTLNTRLHKHTDTHSQNSSRRAIEAEAKHKMHCSDITKFNVVAQLEGVNGRPLNMSIREHSNTAQDIGQKTA